VIVEYLEETQRKPLHPRDPLRRAEHRSWMEFGSAALNEIAGLYAAPDKAAFTGKAKALSEKFALLEGRLATGPYFDDDRFSLVDAVFGPVFRYFDVFDLIGEFGILSGKTKVISWRKALAGRPSIRTAVAPTTNRVFGSFLKRGIHTCHVLWPGPCLNRKWRWGRPATSAIGPASEGYSTTAALLEAQARLCREPSFSRRHTRRDRAKP